MLKQTLCVSCLAACAPCSAQLLFTDVTDINGLSAVPDNDSESAVCGDFNRDGHQDLYIPSHNGVADLLFINNGDGTFTDQAVAWGISTVHYGRSATVGDCNNDGWLDIYVMSMGSTPEPGEIGRHKLLINNGNGTFTDTAGAAGVGQTNTFPPQAIGPGQGTTCAFGDIDLDGDLDLIAGDWNRNEDGDRLFLNDGTGTFTDVTATSGLFGTDCRSFAPAFLNMDDDIWPELIWVADFGTSRYYDNDGDGTFTDITDTTGTALDDNGMGLAIADFDNDQLFDFYVTSIWSPVPAPSIPGTGNMLYWNQGGNVFIEDADTAGVRDGGWGWGVVTPDLNNDGWNDILEINGMPRPEFEVEQAYLWLNDGDGTFTEAALATGLDYDQQGRGLLNFDCDNDGDQDIVFTSRSDAFAFFRNDLPTGAASGNGYLRVFIDTSTDDRLAPDGFGTIMHCTVGSNTQSGFIAGECHHRSQSELAAHFGLGSATTADTLEIRWANGRRTTLTDVKGDTTMTVTFCPADWAGNHRIDSCDILAYLNDYVAASNGGSWINGNPDLAEPYGVVNTSDVMAFLNTYSDSDFSAMCP